MEAAKYIPWLPALGAVLCGLCCMSKSLRKLAAPIAIAAVGGAFVCTLIVWGNVEAFDPENPQANIIKLWDWMHIGDEFKVNMSYYVDPLTVLMLLVITGIGTLVTWYAAGYMAGDRGYARFFAAVCLFIFAMTTLVMADNMVLVYLGWEGVGLCSYLLIGFYYDKPAAVAAAKKAFIVNRIGDLGFALGIFLTWWHYDTVQLSQVAANAGLAADPIKDTWIPFLLMLGAFGKSAQIPLYVWLPDAMEGPTPVSALIHAATMVTAGVYMICRLLPVFSPALSHYALPVVACVGGLTALFAATIAMCQYDIKRVFAYSTISQLGYMFLAVGVMSSVGAVFHLFTHAFFKALLFLTAGSVMHSLAGQLDMRKMSGLRHKMPITAYLMLIGCLALAGVPPFAGFFSKDMILAAVMERGIGEHGHPLYLLLAIVGLLTAFLTAFYTFRLWFRVFMGPEEYEMGDEHHAEETDTHHGHADEKQDADYHVEHHHEPHEMPFWKMNAPLVVLAIGSIFAGMMGDQFVEHSVKDSTANPAAIVEAAAAVGVHHAGVAGPLMHVGLGEHPHLLGMDLHTAMMLISTLLALSGIGLAAYFHWFKRSAADRVAKQFSGVVRLLENKYYVDEMNDRAIVKPLRLLGQLFFVFDRLVIEQLVNLVGFVPRFVGYILRPIQRGVLQGYGLGMAVGAVILLAIVLFTIAN